MRALRTAVILVLALTLWACATVALAPPAKDQQAKTFEVSEQEANIYVFRRAKIAGDALLLPIYLDGQFVGGVAPETFLLLQVNPGKHTVAAIMQEGLAVITLRAESRTNYFIKAQPSWGLLGPIAELYQVPETVAREAIQDLSLALHIE